MSGARWIGRPRVKVLCFSTDGRVELLRSGFRLVEWPVHPSFVRRQPRKLLVVATGNIPNNELRAPFLANTSSRIALLFEEHSHIELSRQGFLVHE